MRRGATDLLSSAPIWVKPGGPRDIYMIEPFAYAETARRIERLTVVRSVLPWRNSFLDFNGRRLWVLGIPPQTPNPIPKSQFWEGSLSTADRHLREGGWVTVSQTVARADHLQIGRPFSLPTPSGVVQMRLAATTSSYGWLPGTIVMNADDHARLWGDTSATALAVTLKNGVPVHTGRQAVRRALPRGSALTVQTSSEGQAEISTVLGSTLSRLNDTTIVVLIAAIASVIALMIAAVSQRRSRLDSLIAMGMSSAQIARLFFYENGTVLLGGCLIGMLSGFAGQYLIENGLHTVTGAPVQYTPAWQLGLRTVAIVTGISLAASILAALRTAVGAAPNAAFSTE